MIAPLEELLTCSTRVPGSLVRARSTSFCAHRVPRRVSVRGEQIKFPLLLLTLSAAIRF
jgi:hypothetical protein